MIANVIVVSALVLAGVFVVLWLFSSDLRRRIEEPKRHFQQQVHDYDERFAAKDADKR
jgi:hypothetical protein